MIFRITVCALFAFLINEPVIPQVKVVFKAEDGLTVVADHYPVNRTYPYILLFHQMESGRGEFRDIALRLNRLGFNCLAVDLRSGNEIDFIRNETAVNALSGRVSRRLYDNRKDMEAAIEFTKIHTELPLILFGSSFSASLSLILAKVRDDISGVVALSPGEYFAGTLPVRQQIAGLEKPAWIAAGASEIGFVRELTEGIAGLYKQVFLVNQENVRGTRILSTNEPVSSEAWLSLMVFLNNLKNSQVDLED